MATKTKKIKAAGRFGAGYGSTPKRKLAEIESKQRKKQKCPFCGKLGAKRISKGIWQCTKKSCGKKFASDAFYLRE